ncbi:MAG: hypothetical protein WBN34_09970 [Woeseia sp.]
MSIPQFSLLALCLAAFSACASNQQEPATGKPAIIDVFACSDYCPGPRGKYMKKVYEGVTDEEACRKLGGTPYTYVGWGSHFVCLAQ